MSHVKRVIFITGTDTNIGKTVLTSLLARRFAAKSIPFAAIKPLCSGGRDDAAILHALQRDRLSLDEINPWHFRQPVSPFIAARNAGVRITIRKVVDHIHEIQSRFPIVIVEGAGGLLSPMGEDFDSRDLIFALKALPVVVSANRLGVVNQIRLVIESLPKRAAGTCPVVCFSPKTPDASTSDNMSLLKHYIAAGRIHSLPWFNWKKEKLNLAVISTLDKLTRNLLSASKL